MDGDRQLNREQITLPPVITKEEKGAAVGDISELEEPVSPAATLFHEPEFNCHVLALIGFDKKIDVDVFRNGLEATLVRHPRFSSIQMWNPNGKGKWVRTKVKLGEHIIVPALNPTTISSPDSFIDNYVSSLSTTLLDLSKPLWDLHILNLPTSEAEATLVFRVHHSLGDGVSLISLLLACTRNAADPAALPTLPNPRKARVESSSSKDRWRMWSVLAAWVMTFLAVVQNTLIDILLISATVLGLLKDTDTPLKAEKGAAKTKRVRFVFRTMSLEDLRVIKRAADATINDALLGVVSAGLARYLGRKCGGSALPTDLRIRSTAIVNLRKSLGIHAAANMMTEAHGSKDWGNLVGYMIIPFLVQQLDSPLDYVKAAKEITGRKKLSLGALFTYSSANLARKIFGVKAVALLCSRLLSNTTMTFSNIAGPTEEISFYGHRIVYVAPTGYGLPQAMSVHFQSYMGKMKIVLAVDESVIHDPQQLCDDILESVHLVKEAALRVGSPNR